MDNMEETDKTTNVISNVTPYPETTKGLGYEFFMAMTRNKDRVAQYIAETGYEDSYESFLQRATRTALHLKERNFTPEDVVCLSSYNQVHCAVPFIACLFLGVPVSSLDPSFTEPDALHAINLVKPKIFFIVPEILDTIQKSIKTLGLEAEIVVYGDHEDPTGAVKSFNDFLEPHPEEDAFAPVEIDDVNRTAVIFFSSGTTGLPKGICSSHKAIFHQGCLMHFLGHLIKNSVICLYSTLYWISAVLYLTSSILHGSARVLSRTFDPEALWLNIDKYKVTNLFLAPIQAYGMIDAGRPENTLTSSLHLTLTGGMQFSLEKLYSLRDLLPGTFVFQIYGCTEISGIGMSFNLNRSKDRLLLNYRPKSVGRPVPGLRYKVVDLESGANVGPNEHGELRIDPEFTTRGYYRQDSSSAFDSDGWMRTGDIVYYDEDYCFYIVDRIKEMLKYRSWHVPPALLEGVLQNHPGVSQCVVIGIPDELDGDLPCAIIVLNEDYRGKVTEEEIEEFVAKRVNDTHKLRGGVKFIEALPLTPSGKVKKKKIRDMVLNGEI
ncbi:uncharacterized protein LOC126747336 isoform X2 [Anthonomus grandis grandis]|uniref:uncharacterized protein LOC126747336 isoform X2 n=1 Tax=Anthonomus grandis grandis TaxID=2921223 RepID=UPI0021659314|nr:uncharacterized protein LOC126747336 isoform X2 [Anthonomus grandis grandis]